MHGIVIVLRLESSFIELLVNDFIAQLSLKYLYLKDTQVKSENTVLVYYYYSGKC